MEDKDFADIKKHITLLVKTLDPNSEETFRMHRIINKVLTAHLDEKMTAEVVEEFKKHELIERQEINHLNSIWNMKI